MEVMKELNKSAEIVEKENHYLDQRQFVFLWGPAVSCPSLKKKLLVEVLWGAEKRKKTEQQTALLSNLGGFK